MCLTLPQIKLGDLHEGGILRNLYLRYNDPAGCKIYVSYFKTDMQFI